jgi:hypothetical protein
VFDAGFVALVDIVESAWNSHLAKIAVARRDGTSPPIWSLHEALKDCLPALLAASRLMVEIRGRDAR